MNFKNSMLPSINSTRIKSSKRMYNNIRAEDKMYEGKKIILEKDKVLKTYPVLSTQISKQ